MNSNSNVYGSVEISEDGIFEHVDRRRVLGVTKKEIFHIMCLRGFGAQRPFVQTVCGLIFALFGCAGLRSVLLWFLGGGSLYLDLAMVIIAFFPFGVWMMLGGLRRAYILLIETPSSTQKITFQGKIKQECLYEFLQKKQIEFGYTIRIAS